MKSPFLGFGSEDALRHFADGLVDAVFTTDAQGVVSYWSPAATRITGWTSEEAVGTECSILAGDTHDGCSCGVGPIRCGLALAGPSSKRCTIRTKDGRILVIVKSAVPVRNAAGETTGALESFTVIGQQQELPARDAAPGEIAGLVGSHPVMQTLGKMIRLVASSDATVMIVGESGTGKERIAEAIHRLGPRASGPFVRIPCAELGQALAAAFSDAAATTPTPPDLGALGAARGGTLLLDEIGDLSPADQIALLRLIERCEACRARGPQSSQHWFRMLCTTRSELKPMVDAERFRADLYFRLNVFPLRAPALREHITDLPAIADQIASSLTPPAVLTPESLGPLLAYDWPGNVRELRNVLGYAALHAEGGPVLPEHFPAPIQPAPSAATRDERTVLLETLARHGGNRTLTARELGISRVTLWKRLKRHGIAESDEA